MRHHDHITLDLRRVRSFTCFTDLKGTARQINSPCLDKSERSLSVISTVDFCYKYVPLSTYFATGKKYFTDPKLRFDIQLHLHKSLIRNYSSLTLLPCSLNTGPLDSILPDLKHLSKYSFQTRLLLFNK